MLTLRGFQGGNGWLWEIFRKDVSLRTSYNPCGNGFFVTSSRRMLVKGWFLTNCSRPLCQEGHWSRTSRYFYQSWEQRVEQIREQSLILDVWSMRSTMWTPHHCRSAEDRRRCNCQSCGESFAFGQVNHRHEYESISRIKIRSTSNLH